MSISGALDTAAALVARITDDLGTRITLERSAGPVHGSPVNEDLTVAEDWSNVYVDVPAIVIVAGEAALTGVEGGPPPGSWRVVMTGDRTDVHPGDRVTVLASRDARLVGRQAIVSDLLDTSAGVARVADAKPT